ncbi:hypothetical protein COM13_09130 [Bacillus pseudomycoides]|uniref:Immunity protein 63 domain-containing protein n=1 Tax=Bacillus pseudomycoides TaxID=64104 RepID=A0ABD6T4M5_9BACI|nr:hypothetical protein [Bacillus pseudomycoides]MBD5799998.1 hypothetical protein [Bacillus pseudomycoides]MED1478197.1 hypothetical protein [Bacillus pseudomycoides]PEK39068.1 hypothetical protein CN691_03815 [Bacillus pseudomycoides]PEO81894.1 hypothetical protein CN571_25665 [Bacillus pseudomycoides]PFW92270.1 hypothetical protein COL29_16400 [Bacillus pseudomycoides]
MMSNEQSKKRLQKMNSLLISKLKEQFEIGVYQDQVSEDEEKDYHYFIFETGGFEKTDSKFTLKQNVLIRYYSENRDDLDERMLDIIAALEAAGNSFQHSNKTSIQKGELDEYIDEIEIYVTRLVKYGC